MHELNSNVMSVHTRISNSWKKEKPLVLFTYTYYLVLQCIYLLTDKWAFILPHLLQTFRESNVYYIAWYFTESTIPFIPKYLLFGFSEIKCKQLFSIQGQVYDFFLSSTSIKRQTNFWEKTLCEQEQVKICKVVFLKMEFQKFIFFSL